MKTVATVKYIVTTILCCFILSAAFLLFDGTHAVVFAENALDAENKKMETASVTIVAETCESGANGKKLKKYEYIDTPVIASDFTVAEEIERRRINAPLEQKIELVDAYIQKGADYKTALGVCFPLLVRTVDEIAASMYVAPKDAQVLYNDGSFRITHERSGRALDENMLYAGIYCSFKYDGASRCVRASSVPVAPQSTYAEISENFKLRGEYTTEFKTSTAARAHNVTLALERVGGAKIEPGAVLSFNAAVGERTQENGFEKAKIIVDGKYTDGVGGGVCQASTAVYNACLKAGLYANANAHSICPSYCPAGLDAMISAFSDLTVTNTTAHPVYIAVKTSGKSATVRVYGEYTDYTVVPRSETVKTVPHECVETVDGEHKYFDESATPGDKRLVSPGKDGISSVTYLDYYRNGQLIKSEKLRENEYRQTPQIIAVAP